MYSTLAITRIIQSRNYIHIYLLYIRHSLKKIDIEEEEGEEETFICNSTYDP